MNAPTRLMDDDRFSASLRADLRAASTTPPVEYDARAGLERFTALVALPAVGIAAVATTKAAALGASSTAVVTGGAATGVKIGVGLKLALGFVAAASIVTGSVYVATRPAPLVPSSASATAAVVLVDPPQRPTEPESVQAPAPPAPEKPAPTAKPTASASADPKATVKAELAHHAELRAAIGDPARALQLANEGHAKFPRGVFGQEREIIAIQALQRLGRTDEAKRRSDAFVAAHPESMYAKSLREQQ